MKGKNEISILWTQLINFMNFVNWQSAWVDDGGTRSDETKLIFAASDPINKFSCKTV